MEELYIGLEVIIDYDSCLDQDVKDWFEDASNFEGFATIESFDDSYCWIEGCPYAIQLEYVMTFEELEQA